MHVDPEGPSALTPGSSRLRLRSRPARATTHGAARTPLQLPPTGGGAGLWLPFALLFWEEPCPAALPLWAACPAAPDFLSLISQEVTGRAGRGGRSEALLRASQLGPGPPGPSTEPRRAGRLLSRQGGRDHGYRRRPRPRGPLRSLHSTWSTGLRGRGQDLSTPPGPTLVNGARTGH